MKIYLASRSENRPACKVLKFILEEYGHQVTSEWLNVEDHHFEAEHQGTLVPERKQKFACRDFKNINEADIVLEMLDCDLQGMRGGVLVEHGYALAKGIPVWVVGKQPTIFHYHPGVTYFPTFIDAIRMLKETT